MCCPVSVKEIFSEPPFFDDAAGGLGHLPSLAEVCRNLMDFWISSTAVIASLCAPRTFKNLANLSGTFRAQYPTHVNVPYRQPAGRFSVLPSRAYSRRIRSASFLMTVVAEDLATVACTVLVGRSAAFLIPRRPSRLQFLCGGQPSSSKRFANPLLQSISVRFFLSAAHWMDCAAQR